MAKVKSAKKIKKRAKQKKTEDHAAWLSRLGSMFDAGKTVPRDVAVPVIGAAREIVWWDCFAVPSDYDAAEFSAALAGVPAGGMVKIEQSAVPSGLWEQHRQDFGAPGGHGLKLYDSPDVVAGWRHDEFTSGVLVGYRAA